MEMSNLHQANSVVTKAQNKEVLSAAAGQYRPTQPSVTCNTAKFKIAWVTGANFGMDIIRSGRKLVKDSTGKSIWLGM